MNTLTYRGLTVEQGQILVGRVVGCTHDGRPLQVIAAELPVGGGAGVALIVEEWDVDLPGYGPAAHQAVGNYQRVTQPGWQRTPPVAVS
jgi:hypothetical protein